MTGNIITVFVVLAYMYNSSPQYTIICVYGCHIVLTLVIRGDLVALPCF